MDFLKKTTSMKKVLNFDLIGFIIKEIKTLDFKYLLSNLLVFVCALLTYAAAFFSNVYNNDGLGRILRVDSSYLEGISKGRWAYPFFYNIFNKSINLPLINALISIIILLLTINFIWKIFSISNIFVRVIVGCIFISTPIFVHFLFYTGDSEVYASGILLIVISVYQLFHSKRGLINYLFVIALQIIALACYPALVSITFTLIVSFIIFHFFNNSDIKSSSLLLFEGILVATTSLLLYFLISKTLLFLFNIELTSYKNANQINVRDLIIKLPYKIIWTLLLFVKYIIAGSTLLKIITAIQLFFISSMAFQTFRHSFKKLFFIFTLNFILIISTHFVYLITFEKWSYLGFQWGMIIFTSLLIVHPLTRSKKILNSIIVLISFLFIFDNIQINNEIIQKHKLKVQSSKMLIYDLVKSVQKIDGFEMNKTKIAFIGDITNNNNYTFSTILPNVIVLNGIDTHPIGFNGYNPSNKIYNQSFLLGFDIKIANEEEIEKAQDFALKNKLPNYPKKGSIFLKDSIVIVNLGTKKTSQEFLNSKTKRASLIEYLESKI